MLGDIRTRNRATGSGAQIAVAVVRNADNRKKTDGKPDLCPRRICLPI